MKTISILPFVTTLQKKIFYIDLEMDRSDPIMKMMRMKKSHMVSVGRKKKIEKLLINIYKK
jgi:hypothetical protein